MKYWKKVLISIIFTIIIYFGVLLLFTGSFFLSSTSLKGKCNTNNKIGIINIAHRGDTEQAQENTIDAFLSAISKGYGIEMDIFTIKTGEFVVFHDTNALFTTGIDMNIESASLEEIQALSYKQSLYNYYYDKKRKIPLLKDVLFEVCKANPNVAINFDLKYVPVRRKNKKLMEIIDSSPCSCSDIQFFIIETPYFYTANSITSLLQKSRCGKIITVGTYIHPGVYPLGTYLWLRTQMIMNFGRPQSITTSFTVWKKYPELIDMYVKNGFCVSVYGDFYENLKDFHVSQYRVIDTSNASHFNVTYNGEVDGYSLVILVLVMGIVLFLIGVTLFILSCCDYICKSDDADECGNKELYFIVSPVKRKVKREMKSSSTRIDMIYINDKDEKDNENCETKKEKSEELQLKENKKEAKNDKK